MAKSEHERCTYEKDRTKSKNNMKDDLQTLIIKFFN